MDIGCHANHPEFRMRSESEESTACRWWSNQSGFWKPEQMTPEVQTKVPAVADPGFPRGTPTRDGVLTYYLAYILHENERQFWPPPPPLRSATDQCPTKGIDIIQKLGKSKNVLSPLYWAWQSLFCSMPSPPHPRLFFLWKEKYSWREFLLNENDLLQMSFMLCKLFHIFWRPWYRIPCLFLYSTTSGFWPLYSAVTSLLRSKYLVH